MVRKGEEVYLNAGPALRVPERPKLVTYLSMTCVFIYHIRCLFVHGLERSASWCLRHGVSQVQATMRCSVRDATSETDHAADQTQQSARLTRWCLSITTLSSLFIS
jgi:hypothetical protein